MEQSLVRPRGSGSIAPSGITAKIALFARDES
jgi:hypothetical protein